MKKLAALSLTLALVVPAFAAAATLRVTSPKTGDTYGLGETIDISWTPASKPIAVIQMLSTRGSGAALGLYGELASTSVPNTEGRFSYKLPDYLVVSAGQYRVRLYPADGTPAAESRTFNLVSYGAPEQERAKPSYSIGKLAKFSKTFAPGAAVRVEISAFEARKVVATPARGFNVQAYLYASADLTRQISAQNALYATSSKTWLAEFVAPKTPGQYEIMTSLFCGDLASTSYCAQKYEDAQVLKTVKFKVK